MRIAHICLANFFIDGWGYQENILTKLHHEMGHEVVIIASTETYLDRNRLGYVKPANYLSEAGIQIHRIAYARWVPRKMQSKIRAYEGLKAHLEQFRPDLIFVHDVQFWDFLEIRRYVQKYPTPVYADCHTDFVNSARGFVSRHLLHGIFYRQILKRVDSIVDRYLPTLPARGDFLHDVYGISRSKIELLPFGADDSLTAGLNRETVRSDMRSELGIPEDDIVFVTGGKLDMRKNIHTLIERFSVAKHAGNMRNVHLIVFGQANPEVQILLAGINAHSDVHLLGWTEASKIFRLFWASDLAIFPGTHSVLWEEAIGHGLGAVFHLWPGMDHLDLGGNARFIDDAAPSTLDALLQELTTDNAAEVRSLGAVAAAKGPCRFAYTSIAAKAIGPV